mgnify:CR=1 FL=1
MRIYLFSKNILCRIDNLFTFTYVIKSTTNLSIPMNYQEFYNQSIQSPEAFWKEQADQLEWYSKPTTILSKDDNDDVNTDTLLIPPAEIEAE